jgi:hypothetical protein
MATPVAASPPIATVAPATKPSPRIVTGVPPSIDPATGLIDVTCTRGMGVPAS